MPVRVRSSEGLGRILSGARRTGKRLRLRMSSVFLVTCSEPIRNLEAVTNQGWADGATKRTAALRTESTKQRRGCAYRYAEGARLVASIAGEWFKRQ